MCRGKLQVLGGFIGDEELDGDAGLEDAPKSVTPLEERSILSEDEGRIIPPPVSGIHFSGIHLYALFVEVIALRIRPKHFGGHARGDFDELGVGVRGGFHAFSP